MSSNYYGSVAGGLADEGEVLECAFLAWLDEFARREASGTYHDALHEAFTAGAAFAAQSGASAAERQRIVQLAAESGATCIAQGGVEIPFADPIGEPQERSDGKERGNG